MYISIYAIKYINYLQQHKIRDVQTDVQVVRGGRRWSRSVVHEGDSTGEEAALMSGDSGFWTMAVTRVLEVFINHLGPLPGTNPGDQAGEQQ